MSADYFTAPSSVSTENMNEDKKHQAVVPACSFDKIDKKISSIFVFIHVNHLAAFPHKQ